MTYQFSMPQPPDHGYVPDAPAFGSTPPSHEPDSEGNSKKEILQFAVVAVIVLGLIAWFVSFKTGRQPESIVAPTFTRDMMTPATAPVGTSVFTTEVVNRLFSGDGIEIPFNVTFRGSEEWSSKIVIPEQRMTLLASHPKRQKLVRTQIARFSELAQFWATYQGNLVYELHFDNTDGVPPSLDRLARQQVDNLGIKQALRLGHGVEFWTFKLSSELRLEDDHVTITKGAGEAAYGQIESKLTEMLADDRKKPNTSLASGLFNSLGKNQGRKNRTVLVLTDGIENSTLADFYHKIPQPDKALWSKLQTQIPCPDVKGLVIIWKGFRSSDATEAQILAAQQVWQFGLGTVGHANLKMEY